VRERGEPAVGPLSTSGGETAVRTAEGLWAVFPWVEGLRGERGRLSERQLRALGETHGRLDRTLARHAFSRTPIPPPAWDAAKSRSEIEAAREAAIRQGAADEAVSAMTRQAELLERDAPSPARQFSWLPTQLLHGDFHDQQVLFDERDEVIAITDWELFRVAPRIRQLLRALDFGLLLDGVGLEAYLAGYRREVVIGEDEARAGVRFWRLDRLYSTWLWGACFLEGNERAAEFLPRAVETVWRLADDAWWDRVERRFVRATLGR
jgi:Ser/Thr protein kinase RdoA (MazF antagonist)